MHLLHLILQGSSSPRSLAATPVTSVISPEMDHVGLLPSSTITFNGRKRRALVVGAGPVGCLAALSLAKSGWSVDVYEGRPDMRLPSSKSNPAIAQRSINLAISSRGIAALFAVDPKMADTFLASAIPMKGRMLHHESGGLESQLYDPHGQCINSLDRGILNEQLLNEASSPEKDIRIFFDHKLTTADFDRGTATFTRNAGGGPPVEVSFDFCVGADGSYSNVRRQMMRFVKMDYQQSYIPHEYVELRMPPGPLDPQTGAATFLMDPNHLHIWPRHSFMLIALPNKDKSFTCTLFAPTSDLELLRTANDVLSWFRLHFPDAVGLIGEELLVSDFLRNPKSSLISVKARPYHYKDRVVIIGDAAHSMVPFYGQGLNCGLEDVRVLQVIFGQWGVSGWHQVGATKDMNDSWQQVPSEDESDDPQRVHEDVKLRGALEEYSKIRHEDLVAISDLATQNYTEMRHDVTTPVYKLLKRIDDFLASFSPQPSFLSLAQTLMSTTFTSASSPPTLTLLRKWEWVPMYTMITFRPDISYSSAQHRAHQQNRILKSGLWMSVIAVAGFGATIAIRYRKLLGWKGVPL